MMASDDRKTKKQLISELAALRRKVAAPEPSVVREKSPPDMADRFQRLFDTISDAVFILDWDSQTLVDVNAGAEKIYGYSHQEFFGKKLDDLSAEPKLSRKFLKELPLNRQAFVPLRYHRRKDGSRFPAEVTAGRYSAEGRSLFYAVVHDITERKQIEDALRVSEARALLLLQIPTTAIMLLDTKACFIEVNETMTKRFHRNREKMLGLCLWDILPPHVAELRKGYFAQALSTGEMVRWVDERQGMWNDNSFIPVAGARGRINQVIGFAVDITAGKMAEQKLRESEQRYRALVESIPEAIVTADENGKIVMFNRGAEAMYGYSAQSVLGKDFRLIVTAKSRKRHAKIFPDLIRAAGPALPGAPAVGWGKRKNGSIFDVEHAFSMYREGGRHFFTTVVRDITERKKTEARLHESEQLFRLTFEHAPVGIALFNKKGSILSVNAVFAGMFGSPGSAGKSWSFYNALHPEEQAESLKTLLASPEKLRHARAAEKRYIARDGRTIYVKEYTQGIFTADGEFSFAIVLIQDITVSKQMESMNVDILLKLKNIYNDLAEFSSTLPPEQQFSKLKSVQDFKLSPTEHRVLSLVCNGYSNKQIASQLHISENTVKHHVTSIFSKTGATSRTQLLSALRKHRIMF